jgi:hypothetical protein
MVVQSLGSSLWEVGEMAVVVVAVVGVILVGL